mmetsp:Transcript_20928/g.55833  ORF Transcript_20928/g.55833 Transcript_20928/m.55833 type:complete len:336 (-) Transcript_20928:23-1030(-)
MTKLRVVVDSDGGIDDATAVAWLLCRPDVEVVAFTAVFGNGPAKNAARNLRIVTEHFGAGHVPVHEGLDAPFGPCCEVGSAAFVHGHDGLADIGLPDPEVGAASSDAVRILTTLPNEAPGELTLITLGPLSNIASAVALAPSSAAAWREVIIMGGASTDAGNARPGCEANAVRDPSALAKVVQASWRTPPLLVGLDATQTATVSVAEAALLDECKNKASSFLSPLLLFYRTPGGALCPDGEFPIHDLLAAMCAVERDVVEVVDLPCAVVTDVDSLVCGATLVDRRWLGWRRQENAHIQSCPPGMHMIRWAVRGNPAVFRAHLERWWSSEDGSASA